MAVENVEFEVTEEEIIIRVRKDVILRLSSTKKSNLVGTTGGLVEVEDGILIGVNCVRPLKKKS